MIRCYLWVCACMHIYSTLISSVGMCIFKDKTKELKEQMTQKSRSFVGLGLGRTASLEKAAPFAVGTGVTVERTNTGTAVSANLAMALKEDLDRIQAECATQQVLHEAGPKLLLFASDGMYVLSPGNMGMGNVVKVAPTTPP